MKKDAKQYAETTIPATAGAVQKADVLVKVRSRISAAIEENVDVQNFIKDILIYGFSVDEVKKWMLEKNIKEVKSTDGTVKLTLQDAVYGYRPITDEEQKRLDSHRAPIQRLSYSELLEMDPELAAQMYDDEHRTEAPIKKAYVKCQDQRASLTELNEVCERVVAIEENKRLYRPEPQA